VLRFISGQRGFRRRNARRHGARFLLAARARPPPGRPDGSFADHGEHPRDPPLIFSLIYSFVGDLDGLDLTLTDLCAVQRSARGGDNTGIDICIHPCSRGRDNSGMNTSIDIFIHPGTEHGNPRTEHGNSRTEDGIKRPTAPPQAVAGAVADTFRPLLDNLNQLCSFRTVFDIEDYHIGMPFGKQVATSCLQ
jgi:hypothetical protein